MSQPLLSICIPVYNGIGHIEVLLKSLLKSSRLDFEIISVDDCSTDESWKFISTLAQSEARLSCERNAETLGMDRNFDRVASVATGKYIWFCGQDDVIESDGLDKVLELLTERSSLDFVLMTHNKRIANQFGEYVLEEDKLDRHVFGAGIAAYLIHTNYRLPTFLPKYCIRRDLWLRSDPSFYFGTHYCQVGVFLEVARDIEWCHFAGNFVTGLEPLDGWQLNADSYITIAFGYLTMLARAAARVTWINSRVIGKLLRMQRRRLIFSCLLLRHHRIRVPQTLWVEAWRAVIPYKEISVLAFLPFQIPRKCSSLFISVIDLRRKMRAFIRVRLNSKSL